MKPHEKHRALGLKEVGAAVVTVSTSRFEAKDSGKRFTDESGDVASNELARAGISVSRRELVSDEASMIRDEVEKFLAGREDVLIFVGGTGVSPRDVTVDTVHPYLEKEIQGFGELMRSISFRKVGTPAILSRATAGVVKGKLIVCLPGSPDAARTGLRIFGKELPHILFVARS
ncbi:MAG: MogA/MoaB family molybdenum cofactor biosynthesis protein [Nitrososphaerales archaeon]|nr:MogA/MoaB family molybdenum cofactor biosynthesis protein [Nitrososphaerales archaeon]